MKYAKTQAARHTNMPKCEKCIHSAGEEGKTFPLDKCNLTFCRLPPPAWQPTTFNNLFDVLDALSLFWLLSLWAVIGLFGHQGTLTPLPAWWLFCLISLIAFTKKLAKCQAFPWLPTYTAYKFSPIEDFNFWLCNSKVFVNWMFAKKIMASHIEKNLNNQGFSLVESVT